jgi:hypothetical protein
MAYVRKKKTKGREYYQLVEGKRVDGKVRQKVLAHLGDCPSAKLALRRWSREIVKLREAMDSPLGAAEVNRSVISKRLAEEDEECRRLALRFVDEDGNMRPRPKYVPHQLHQLWIGNETHDFRGGRAGCYGWWQYEYWQHIEYADRLERRANELEDRYAGLRAALGDNPEEARQDLKDRLERRAKAEERRVSRLYARDVEARRATGISIIAEVAKTNPILGMQAMLHGYEVPADS